ncbi:MAG: TusE/DsrC/DsvC family sulfur relay protein [Bacteroidetes bacterium]|nr:TusE/DsrC/DsvC family sulfur relay protein [Bacteroidota bacterium]
METVLTQALPVNKEGYLLDSKLWTPEWAKEVAAQLNITLTDKHFEVLKWLRDKHASGVPLTIRKVGASGLVDIKEFYALFPGGPLKISSKIAGIPKPASCI